MNQHPNPVETLKEVLDHIHHPEQLEVHPWLSSLFVQAAVNNHPGLLERSQGERLVFAVSELFRQMMPGVPPKRGVRLDPRWGEFGLLAARYFAPLMFGAPRPMSLRDAWGRIDAAILLFVFGEGKDIPPEDAAQYTLVADEPQVAPTSTLSDWHRKGVERLVDIIQAREHSLSLSMSQNAEELLPSAGQPGEGAKAAGQEPSARTKRRPLSRFLGCYLFLALGLIAVGLLGIKVWRLRGLEEKVWQDVSQLRTLRTPAVTPQTIESAGSLIVMLRQDMEALHQEAKPVLWMGRGLRWVPVYGCDLASARDLLDLASHLAIFADRTYPIAQPVLSEVVGGAQLNSEEITGLLVQNQAEFLMGREVLDQALAARSKITPQCLSPRLRAAVINDVDPVLSLLDDGLSLALAFPELLGATRTGPKTYLLLAQNEDELRPTGGFITAAGNLVVQDGKIVNLSFEDSYNVDDISKPYPLAPWQLDQYMNLRVLFFRDANWFSDYPTTALWAEYLYAYSRSHSVDGVIAFDQQMLVLLLNALGPMNIDGEVITAKNVLSYIRESKKPPSEDVLFSDWDRKRILNPLASELRRVILAQSGPKFKALFNAILRALNEHHLLLQFDNLEVSRLISKRGWDGAMRPENGDFLMVVDTNVGYSKTNAVVEGKVDYDVNLTDLGAPSANLTVFRTNDATGDPPCIMGRRPPGANDRYYPINRCYWNYLRVYVPEGTQLLDSSPPPSVPGALMVLNRSVPDPRVDTLDDEEIEEIQTFGTLMVVPAGQSASAGFHFALPAAVLSVEPGSHRIIYKLKIQKQPGVIAHRMTIRVHLPAGATVEQAPQGCSVQGENLIYNTDLKTDLYFEIIFRVP